jgi:hypothetical protein
LQVEVGEVADPLGALLGCQEVPQFGRLHVAVAARDDFVGASQAGLGL